MRPILAALLFCGGAWAEQAPETAESIMAKVAANQERAQEARARWVYQQDANIRLLRTNGKMAREERRLYSVSPTEKGVDKKLDQFTGRYAAGKKVLDYDKPGFHYKDVDLDAEVIEGMADDFINDEKSKDGINHELFPLTSAEQKHYLFQLEGREKVKGRDAYRISFRPRPKEEDSCWKGEAWIDATEFQPVIVNTKLSFGIPFLVKAMLGTDVKQFGFQIHYEPVEDGVWFPVSYGTEFRFKAVFLYSRTVTIALSNKEFRKTTVTSELKIDPQQ